MNRTNRFDDEAAQVANYRRPSGLAIAGLVLGLASPLCLLWPLLLVVPLAGAAVAMVALRRIRTSDGALFGGGAAIAGLGLSVVCGLALMSHATITRILQTRQAAEFGRQWIALVASGDLRQAFRFHVLGSHSTGASTEESFGPAGDPFDRFAAIPVVQAMSGIGGGVEVEDGPTVLYAAQGEGEFSVQKEYRVTPAATGASQAAAGAGPARSEPIDVLLTLSRTQLPGQSGTTWLVFSVDAPAR